jgi:outer membrane protein TolC
VLGLRSFHRGIRNRFSGAVLTAVLGAAGLAGCQSATIGTPAELAQSATEAVNPAPAIPSAVANLPKPLEATSETTGKQKADAAIEIPERAALTLPPMMRNGEFTGTIPEASTSRTGSIEATRTLDGPKRSMTLHGAVTQAALTHPEIRAAEAKVREARAGIAIAGSGLYPQGEIKLSAGGSQGGNSTGRGIFERANPDGNMRFDGALTFRQLLFDFGATKADVERSTYVKEAEKLKLLDKVDEIVLKTTQAYLRILEQRALLSLVDETVASHRRLAAIVQANQREGNGTAADVNRVNSRLTDMYAIRSDVALQLSAAEEALFRMTRVRPGQLASAPLLNRSLPGSPEQAVIAMRRNNPRLASMSMTTQSIDKEIEFQRNNQLPRVQLEADGDTKNYGAVNRHKNEVEGRALVTVRYKFMDGGLAQGTQEQLTHRRDANVYMQQNEDEQTSSDIRQAYRSIDSARRKQRLVSEGISTSARVQELYLEQFKAGRRTVFELLDSQMSSFTVRRSEIESRYEGQRATYEILRNTGRLAEALSRAPATGPAAPRFRNAHLTTGSIRPRGNSVATAAMATGQQPSSYPVSTSRMPRRIAEPVAVSAPKSE